MLTSKERAYLRSLASTLDPILMVGKGGVTENVAAEARNALRTRELVKGRVLESALISSREALEALAAAVGAEPVQAIGSKFVLYKENRDLPEEKRIQIKK